MKIVVIGGTGLIGSKLVQKLASEGHDAVPASPNSGVNTLTGEGLAEVLVGADVVVDVSNSPSFEEEAVLDFFSRSTTNLLAAASAAGVGRYVALSVVGTQRLTESPYFRAKIAQEKLIQQADVPWSIVHATQFFEFVGSIADSATVDGVIRLSPALIQPMASDDVAAAVAQIALAAPLRSVVEVAGPERFPLVELVRQGLAMKGDSRDVIADSGARYFGALLDDETLLPGSDAELAGTTFTAWSVNGAPAKAAIS